MATFQDYYADLFNQSLRKAPPSQRLAEISIANASIVKSLLATARKANDKGERAVANEVMDAIGALLDTNKDLQEVVREIKPKID